MRTPIKSGSLQSDLNFTNRKAINADLSDYAGANITWNPVTKTFDTTAAGSNALITVNVKDAPYNATGDGVTDDTAAIQSAINAVCGLGGGTIFFPRGTYLCNGPFDGTDNSILTIPFNGSLTGAGIDIPLALLGEVQGVDGPSCSIIKSTKTGTGTAPALLAGGPYAGTGILTNPDINFTKLFIRNLTFQFNDNPTIHALRLEVLCWASLEDITVKSQNWDTEPTNGTVAVWMPNSGNGAITDCNRITVWGFDTAFRVGEHFRGLNIFVFRAKTGIEFLAANEASWANIMYWQCANDVKFSGYHAVDLLLDEEHEVGGAWYAATTQIVDPSNFGRGKIRYHLVQSGVGPVDGPISVSGATGISFTNLRTGVTTVSSIGSIIGNGTVPPGGATGQSLKKLSNADYDVGWA